MPTAQLSKTPTVSHLHRMLHPSSIIASLNRPLSPPVPRYTLDNRLQVFFDSADRFSVIEEAISHAQKTIKISLNGHEHDLAERLLQKSPSVCIQVILNHVPPTFSLGKQQSSLYPLLKANGIQARVLKRGGCKSRMGFMVIDDQIALMDSFQHTHSLLLHMSGPAVGDLSAQFDYDWLFMHDTSTSSYTTYMPVHKISHLVPPPIGEYSLVRVAGTGKHRQHSQWVILEMLKKAQRSIYIEMGELQDPEIVQFLIRAKRYGIDVRIILNTSMSRWGIPFLKTSNTQIQKQIQTAGISLSRSQEKIHHTMALIDGRTLLISSDDWGTNEHSITIEIQGGQVVRDIHNHFAHQDFFQ